MTLKISNNTIEKSFEMFVYISAKCQLFVYISAKYQKQKMFLTVPEIKWNKRTDTKFGVKIANLA